jgi:Lrp/AsnC family leucine-responsive transcriptional regulator
MELMARKPVQIAELDQIDRRLLRILQRDNQLTNLQLAEQAHLSPPTCLRRVRRLRQEKIIVQDVCLLDPRRVGRNLFVFIEVMLERQDEAAQSAFEAKMKATDEVMQCYMVSGHAGFMIVVQVADMDSFHEFIREVLTDDPHIRNFKSLFAMNRTKFQTEINLDY